MTMPTYSPDDQDDQDDEQEQEQDDSGINRPGDPIPGEFVPTRNDDEE
jgi:hypothetical protein